MRVERACPIVDLQVVKLGIQIPNLSRRCDLERSFVELVLRDGKCTSRLSRLVLSCRPKTLDIKKNIACSTHLLLLLNNFAFELLLNRKPSPVIDSTALFLFFRKRLAKQKSIPVFNVKQ